jgi:hypothetical protein
MGRDRAIGRGTVLVRMTGSVAGYDVETAVS